MSADTNKMKNALHDMQELYEETAAGLYLPKRYRKIPYKQFVEVERAKFLAQLGRDIQHLSNQLNNTEKRPYGKRIVTH